MARKCKYNDSTRWLEPFVDAVAHLVPIERLNAIKGYKVLKNKEPSQQGQIIMDLASRRFVITIKALKYNKESKCYKNEYIGTVLETLAHELAHTKFWEHDTNHWKLQASIQSEFGNVLERDGIEDTGVRFN